MYCTISTLNRVGVYPVSLKLSLAFYRKIHLTTRPFPPAKYNPAAMQVVFHEPFTLLQNLDCEKILRNISTVHR